jgi:hypothetical protein
MFSVRKSQWFVGLALMVVDGQDDGADEQADGPEPRGEQLQRRSRPSGRRSYPGMTCGLAIVPG